MDEWRKWQTVEEKLAQITAERDRLRADAIVANQAAEAAAEAVGAMAEKLSAVLAENNRLRAVVDACAGEVNAIAHETASRLMRDRAAALGRWLAEGAPPDPFAGDPVLDGSPTMGGHAEDTGGVMTGHRPFSELRDGLRRRLADSDETSAMAGRGDGVAEADRDGDADRGVVAGPLRADDAAVPAAAPTVAPEEIEDAAALPAPLRRLQELGQEAADRATVSDEDAQRVFDRIVAEVGIEPLRRYLGTVSGYQASVDPGPATGGCRLDVCPCTRFRPLPDDAELCVCNHTDDEHGVDPTSPTYDPDQYGGDWDAAAGEKP